jgi:hypothetical protein
MMRAQIEALRERRLAAELLGQTCLAIIESPIGEAIGRAYDIDPNLPPETERLLAMMGGG